MKKQKFSFLKFILFMVAALFLIRFLPVFIRAAQGVALGLRAYWWIALPLLISGIVVWKARRQARVVLPPERDVTNSLNQDSP